MLTQWSQERAGFERRDGHDPEWESAAVCE